MESRLEWPWSARVDAEDTREDPGAGHPAGAPVGPSRSRVPAPGAQAGATGDDGEARGEP